MRYLIKRSNRSGSGSERSMFDRDFVTQHRGQILTFIFVLSLVTTLCSLFNFHKGLSPSHSVSIFRFDSAAKLFTINNEAPSEEMMKKNQMYRYLMHKHRAEIKGLKRRVKRGKGHKILIGIEDSSGEKVSEKNRTNANTPVPSMDSNAAVVTPLLINFLATVPSTRQQHGTFVEYYPYGRNTSISVTLPLEQSNVWTGLVLYVGDDSDDEDGKLWSQRITTTYVGTGFKICIPDDELRPRVEKESLHTPKSTVPNPKPLPAPPVVPPQSEAKNNPSTLNAIPAIPIITASLSNGNETGLSESKQPETTTGNKRLTEEEEKPCFSLFSLTQLFQTFSIDFFAIHTPECGQDLRLIMRTLLSLRPLIDIKVISVIPSKLNDRKRTELWDLINYMKSNHYRYQSLPLYREEKIEYIISGKRKVNGQVSKHAVIKDLYKHTVKQLLFVSDKAFSNVSEHFKTYFNL